MPGPGPSQAEHLSEADLLSIFWLGFLFNVFQMMVQAQN
jgi:hypothetical protein